MKIRLICVAKTSDRNIREMVNEYEGRLKHYVSFSMEYIEVKQKNLNQAKLKEEEGKMILNTLEKGSTLILLDEKGKHYDSVNFANFLQKQMNSGIKELVFAIGGAYGFAEEVYARANQKIALSSMTFTHQMIRLIFIEQLYRGFTILRGEKYHH